MGLQFKCNVPQAAPCIYDSRFDPTVTDKAFGGKVKRRHRHVKKGAVLGYVGFESRGQFVAMNEETEKQNEKDRQKLLKLLGDMGAELTGNETLQQLGKSYNFYDPRMKHVFRKSSKVTEKVPIVAMKKSKNATALTPGDEAEKKALQKWLNDNKVEYHHANGVATLRELKAKKEKELSG